MSTLSKMGLVENKGSVPPVPPLPILTGKEEQCKNSMCGRGTLGTHAKNAQWSNFDKHCSHRRPGSERSGNSLRLGLPTWDAVKTSNGGTYENGTINQ